MVLDPALWTSEENFIWCGPVCVRHTLMSPVNEPRFSKFKVPNPARTRYDWPIFINKGLFITSIAGRIPRGVCGFEMTTQIPFVLLPPKLLSIIILTNERHKHYFIHRWGASHHIQIMSCLAFYAS